MPCFFLFLNLVMIHIDSMVCSSSLYLGPQNQDYLRTKEKHQLRPTASVETPSTKITIKVHIYVRSAGQGDVSFSFLQHKDNQS